MKAMLLAAGRGERMRPLTDAMPKPLLHAGGHALIEYHLHALARAGYSGAVINLSWQGARLREFLGDGSRYGIAVAYSDEGAVALETGGGIHNALTQLGPAPFLLVNADIWTDAPLDSLRLPAGALAHLALVDNPEHNLRGDFALGSDGRLAHGGDRLTYSGIAMVDPRLFDTSQPGRFPLKPLLDAALASGRLSGERLAGAWFDLGTPERLATLDEALRDGRLRHPALAARLG